MPSILKYYLPVWFGYDAVRLVRCFEIYCIWIRSNWFWIKFNLKACCDDIKIFLFRLNIFIVVSPSAAVFVARKFWAKTLNHLQRYYYFIDLAPDLSKLVWLVWNGCALLITQLNCNRFHLKSIWIEFNLRRISHLAPVCSTALRNTLELVGKPFVKRKS